MPIDFRKYSKIPRTLIVLLLAPPFAVFVFIVEYTREKRFFRRNNLSIQPRSTTVCPPVSSSSSFERVIDPLYYTDRDSYFNTNYLSGFFFLGEIRRGLQNNIWIIKNGCFSNLRYEIIDDKS